MVLFGFFMLNTKTIVSCQKFAQLDQPVSFRAVLGHEYNIYTHIARKTEFSWMICFPRHDVLVWQVMSQSALLPSASLLRGLLDVSSVPL